jgi:hypothetical protein
MVLLKFGIIFLSYLVIVAYILLLIVHQCAFLAFLYMIFMKTYFRICAVPSKELYFGLTNVSYQWGHRITQGPQQSFNELYQFCL